MEINQIETFLAVAGLGGFHRAAHALGMSQPAVSARIRALEHSLGATLFARGPNGLALSAAGHTLKPHAELLLRTANTARRSVEALEAPNRQALTIAAALTVATYFLPEVLSRFHKSCPNTIVTLHSRSMNSREVLEMVLARQVAIGLARSLSHPQVETVTLRADSLVLVGNCEQQNRYKRPIRLAQVAEWPLIFFDRGSSDWSLTHGLFQRAGLVPNMVMEVEIIETAKKMAQRGLGFAFLPHFSVAQELIRGALSQIRIADAELPRRTLDAIYLRRLHLQSEAQVFLQIARSVAGEVK